MDAELDKLFKSKVDAKFANIPKKSIAFPKPTDAVNSSVKDNAEDAVLSKNKLTKKVKERKKGEETLGSPQDLEKPTTTDTSDAVLVETKVEKELKEKIPESPERLERTVFVGNVPISAVADRKIKKKLVSLFEAIGEVESSRLRSIVGSKNIPKRVAYITKETSQERDACSAFIVFKSPEDAKMALSSLDGKTFEGHHLRVDLASNAKNKPDTKKSVFIGNLPLNVVDESLWKLFSECGAISYVRVIRDPKTGAGKGFGYVAFKDKAAVELALQLNGADCGGRPARISKCAKPGYQEVKKARMEKRQAFLENQKEKSITYNSGGKKPYNNGKEGDASSGTGAGTGKQNTFTNNNSVKKPYNNRKEGGYEYSGAGKQKSFANNNTKTLGNNASREKSFPGNKKFGNVVKHDNNFKPSRTNFNASTRRSLPKLEAKHKPKKVEVLTHHEAAAKRHLAKSNKGQKPKQQVKQVESAKIVKPKSKQLKDNIKPAKQQSKQLETAKVLKRHVKEPKDTKTLKRPKTK